MNKKKRFYRYFDCIHDEKTDERLPENIDVLIDKLNELSNDIEICTEISLKRMYLMLLKAQEIILENNPQHKKREIVSLLSSIEQDILMLNDKNNSINRDLFE